MYHHVVLWAFGDDVPTDKRIALLDAIRSQVLSNPHLRQIAVGPNLSRTRIEGYTHAYWSAFESADEFSKYHNHPSHQPVALLLRGSAAKIVIVDLEQ